MRILTCGIIGRNNRVAPQREFNPPFTGGKVLFYSKKKKIKRRESFEWESFTCLEYKKAIDPTHASVAKECGWEVGEDPLTKKVFQFKVREGRILSVWEVIGENALFSYDIEANPKYRVSYYLFFFH